MRNGFAVLAVTLASCFTLGCGGKTESPASPSNVLESIVDSPQECLWFFLYAVRHRDEFGAREMLTEAARQRVLKKDLQVAAPEGLRFSFLIEGVELTQDETSEELACVSTSWFETYGSSVLVDSIVWRVKLTSAGWRVDLWDEIPFKSIIEQQEWERRIQRRVEAEMARRAELTPLQR